MLKYLTPLLLAALLSGCASLSRPQPEVQLADIQPTGKATLFEQEFEVTLRISNPNQQPLSAQGLRFNVSLDGDNFARGASSQPFSIPALGNDTVKVLLNTSLSGWLKQLGKLAGNHTALRYEIDGTVFGVGGLGDMPFRSRGDWQLPGP
ncbi:LEA type 2 family protein [Vogesella indigofera]|uniref:LEA type 2 family protein n=1 Tax=Vogesella indigofera TaxID=45465 RepID=A0ABT5I4R2_VOGIN|nr:LEA type 2 family protein [Vogesella indigofera]MDC7691172.1 LEA type 2 family protein [Vogesella indigofera]